MIYFDKDTKQRDFNSPKNQAIMKAFKNHHIDLNITHIVNSYYHLNEDFKTDLEEHENYHRYDINGEEYFKSDLEELSEKLEEQESLLSDLEEYDSLKEFYEDDPEFAASEYEQEILRKIEVAEDYKETVWNLQSDVEELQEEIKNAEPHEPTFLAFYVVSSWLHQRIKQNGGVSLEFANHWTYCSESYGDDHILMQIAYDNNFLEGQENEWKV